MNFDQESKLEDFFLGGRGWGGGGGKSDQKKKKKNRYFLIFVLMLYIKFQVPVSSGSLVLIQNKRGNGQ